jgi:hypothetical protein
MIDAVTRQRRALRRRRLRRLAAALQEERDEERSRPAPQRWVPTASARVDARDDRVVTG